MSATFLYDELATVPDPRGLLGLIHPLPAIMGLVALALLMALTQQSSGDTTPRRSPARGTTLVLT